MGWNPKKTMNEIAAGKGAESIATGVKSLGSDIGKLNPYKKGPTYNPGQVDDAQQIVAPTFDPNAFKGASAVQGAPTTFQGGQIGAVNDPRAAIINQAQQAQFRAGQQNLANQLAQQAAGQGPSVSGQQFQQAQKANQAAIFAQMASQRGGPSAMGARNAQMASTQIQAQTARDAAMGRIQEQLAARQQLAGVLDSARQQDIGLATSQAQLQQEAALTKYKGDLEKAIQQGQLDQRTAEQMFAAANQNAQLNAQMSNQMAMQYNDMVAKYASMGMSAQQANQMAAMEVQQMRLGEQHKAFDSKAAAAAAQKAQIGGLVNLAGQAAMAYATGGASLAVPSMTNGPGTVGGTTGAIAPMSDSGAYAGTPAGSAIQNGTFDSYAQNNYFAPYK